MIRPIQRQFGPGRFALGPHRDRSAQEHALELFNYLLDRKLTVKQIQQLVFQGVISHRTVHLLGMFVPSADRKSTRLNSSHLVISYAVFCLKKKKKKLYNDA